MYFVLRVLSLLQGYQLSLVPLSPLEDIYYLSCIYFNVFILSTQAPALHLSPILWALEPLIGGLADNPQGWDLAQASPLSAAGPLTPAPGNKLSSKTSFPVATASLWGWPGFLWSSALHFGSLFLYALASCQAHISEKDLKLTIKSPFPIWDSNSLRSNPSLGLQTSDQVWGVGGSSCPHWLHHMVGGWTYCPACVSPSLSAAHVQSQPLEPWFLWHACHCHSRGLSRRAALFPPDSPWHLVGRVQLLTHQGFASQGVLAVQKISSHFQMSCTFLVYWKHLIFVQSLIKCYIGGGNIHRQTESFSVKV